MAGKGDSPRPVDGDTYRANYERMEWPARSMGKAGRGRRVLLDVPSRCLPLDWHAETRNGEPVEVEWRANASTLFGGIHTDPPGSTFVLISGEQRGEYADGATLDFGPVPDAQELAK